MIGETTPQPRSADVPLASEAPTSLPLVDAGKPEEFGGRKGPEPTRYGDWEKNGRCIDF